MAAITLEQFYEDENPPLMIVTYKKLPNGTYNSRCILGNVPYENLKVDGKNCVESDFIVSKYKINYYLNIRLFF